LKNAIQTPEPYITSAETVDGKVTLFARNATLAHPPPKEGLESAEAEPSPKGRGRPDLSGRVRGLLVATPPNQPKGAQLREEPVYENGNSESDP